MVLGRRWSTYGRVVGSKSRGTERNVRSWSRHLSHAAEAEGHRKDAFCFLQDLGASMFRLAESRTHLWATPAPYRAGAHVELSGLGMQSCAGIFIHDSQIA